MDKKCDNKNSLNFPLKTLPNKNNPFLRLNTICPYYTMFPVDFPFRVLRKVNSKEKVLDPFCGRGTSNFAARLRGMESVGIDTNPVACAIASAKLVHTTPEKIIELCRVILESKKEAEDIPIGEFWDLCYHSSTLHQICKLREYFLDRCESNEEIALRAIILGTMHGPRNKKTPSYLSNQMPRTYASKPNYSIRFWRKSNLVPQEINILDIVIRKAQYSFSHLPPSTSGEILKADCSYPLSKCPIDGFNWVITSPPYYQMKTYVQDQWLRNWFLGGNPEIDYSVKGQLSHSSQETFVGELGKVWKNVADICAPEAKLVIRFGALPSSPVNPTELLRASLEKSNCGWKVLTVKYAGSIPKGKRQADQFSKNVGEIQREIDLYAVLR